MQNDAIGPTQTLYNVSSYVGYSG